MDRYQRNRSYSRPYQSTCGGSGGQDSRQMQERRGRGNGNRSQLIDASEENEMRDMPMGNSFGRSDNQEAEGCSCRLPGNHSNGSMVSDSERRSSLDDMSLAMAYVPMQGRIRDTFDLNDALRLGTLFPELCKPFCGCGKRGGSR